MISKNIEMFKTKCANKINTMTEKELLYAYDSDVTISMLGYSITIPFDAVTVNALFDALDKIKEEQ